jgi:sugar O-acyltransferase (sialic acid O-acetyltransferase NeuD family)
LAILGAGGHGRVVADCAVAAGWSEVTFFDDCKAAGSRAGPWMVQGDRSVLAASLGSFDGFIVAIGDNAARWAAHKTLVALNAAVASSIIHPSASVSPYAEIGAGSTIVAGAIVNIGARIGEACIVNSGSSIDHDSTVGAGVHISPGARLVGGVTVGDLSWIGAGAVVREGITIGSRATVGAGAVVIRPVPDDVTVVGNPAHVLERSRP